MVKELLERNRSYRRFDAEQRISSELLRDIISVNRFVSSASNLQRLRFMRVCEKTLCDRIFPALRWAGYLQEWAGPAPEERPAAYIVIATPKSVTADVGIDVGLSAQAMLTYATEMGVGGCMLLSFDAESVSETLSLGDYRIKLVIALGVPKEKVVITDVKNGDLKYYRDSEMVHYVPKLPLDDILLNPPS